MASRDIANMHLFLDLKKKFPDLPDETLRSNVSLFAENQEKCISLLQKESESHYHPSQPFPDFRLPENKVNSMKNDYAKQFLGNSDESSVPPLSSHASDVTSFSKKSSTFSNRSSIAGVLQLPGNTLNPQPSLKPGSLSAPVITSNELPFNDLYKQNPISSHSSMCQRPINENNQIIFHTTKNHIIEAPVSHESTAYVPISETSEFPRKHTVKLSITPSFPFQPQHVNTFNNSVCATASQSSRFGRHMTSLNFQLQPHSSDQFPLEISTIPTNVGNPSDSKDFGSHVQISVGAQGATFTALRLQHPTYSQARNTPHLSTSKECQEEYSPSSSQAQNSSFCFYPNQRIQPLSSERTSDSFQYPHIQGIPHGQNMFQSQNHNDAYIGAVRNYQFSPDYILAVKNHQIAQLDLIYNELEKEKSFCSQLRAEVNRMEQQVAKRNTSSTAFPLAEDLQKLREEVRNLSVEISCLSMEVDSAGKYPLGVTDPDFYSNIFTGPNGNIASAAQDVPQSISKTLRDKSENKSSFDYDGNDERNHWLCKKCTFANHPALEKCEMCELPKNLDFVESNSGYTPRTCFRFVSNPKQQSQRAVGSVQISVTRRVPSSSKSVKLHLTHRLPR